MNNDGFYKKALNAHGAFVCDMHWDLAPEILLRNRAGERHIIKNRYLDDLKRGGFSLVVSSIYTRPEMIPEKALGDAMLQIAALLEDVDSVSSDVVMVKTKSDFERVLKKEKIGVLMYFEGLDPLGNSKEMLRSFYETGIRGASLTWSRRNLFADGCCSARENFDVKGGLSLLGRETVSYMENLNMFIDASHLNDDGFAELASIAKKPFLATHSCTRTVHFSYRNLTDAQIKTIAEKGGIIGMNGYSEIAGAKGDDPERFSKICAHIEHIVELSGYDHVGYGFDICAPYSEAETRRHDVFQNDCIASHEQAVELTACLLRRGHSEADVKKIIGGNFARFLSSILEA
ncbi:MAG: dipeptidase [Treponema sp.]|jgi:membrane dipeptidase|nr:dipeptidase [Treponema sp.]